MTTKKYYRTYKGKRIQRPETPLEKQDRLFPGQGALTSLSRGIVEEEDETESEEDEEEEDEDDCLIPDIWSKIASPNPEIQRKIQGVINESKKKAKKKKLCRPGAPLHDKDGEFTGPGKQGSWSVSNPDGKSDCDHGKLRTSGKGNHKTWLKQPCGRSDSGKGKAKYRCKDGTLTEDGLISTDTQPDKLRPKAEPSFTDFPVDTGVLMDLQDRLQKILDNHPTFLKHLSYLVKPLVDQEKEQELGSGQLGEKKKRRPLKNMSREQARTVCSRLGFFGWSDFLMKLNAIESAKKGSMNQGKK